VFGRDVAHAGNFPALTELSSLTAANGGDGSAGFILYGVHPQDYSGFIVGTAGDLNDDGISDVMVGARHFGYFGSAGEGYVVFGRNVAQVGRFPPEIALASLNGDDGFVARPHASFEYYTGDFAISPAGDINADGIDDLLCGTVQDSLAFVVFGRSVAQG